MLKINIVYIFLAANVLFVSCRATRNTTNIDSARVTIPTENTITDANRSSGTGKTKTIVIKTGDVAVDYINAYKDIAIEEMKRTGIPASITLAQGMLESDFGRSDLARRGNNHFGIKCHNWNGASVYHNDDRRNDCFRKYGSAEESFRDHSDFIKNGSRYSSLFDLSPYDYKGWAAGLKKAGYATNPHYAALIINQIEENNLEVFDKDYTAENAEKTNPITLKSNANIVAPSTTRESIVVKPSRVMENNRIRYIIVKDGDTREKIEKDFQLLRWELSRYNELGNDFTLSPGQILYLQPKREKAEPGKEQYTFTEGDTMYQVSQKFGIKLKNLYEMNRLDTGAEPKPGTKLWLRGVKPVN